MPQETSSLIIEPIFGIGHIKIVNHILGGLTGKEERQDGMSNNEQMGDSYIIDSNRLLTAAALTLDCHNGHNSARRQWQSTVVSYRHSREPVVELCGQIIAKVSKETNYCDHEQTREPLCSGSPASGARPSAYRAGRVLPNRLLGSIWLARLRGPMRSSVRRSGCLPSCSMRRRNRSSRR